MTSKALSVRRRVLLGVLSSALGLGLTLLLCEGLLRLFPVSNTGSLAVADQLERVNRFTPDATVTWSAGWNFALHTTKHANHAGYLSDVEYRAGAGPGVPLAIIGDSYVEALQVANAESLHGLLSIAAGPETPVYGLGSSGAQLPTYLAYADLARREYHARALAFVIISNDFDESACAYTNFRGFTWCFDVDAPGKPALVVREQPERSALRRLASHSALLRYLTFNAGVSPAWLQRLWQPGKAGMTYVANVPRELPPERVAAARAAVQAFFAVLPATAGLPPGRIAFVMDAVRFDIYGGTNDRAGSFAETMREEFMAAARQRGYEVVDLDPAFRADYAQHGQRFENSVDYHWNALGHWVAASALGRSGVAVAVLGAPLQPPRP